MGVRGLTSYIYSKEHVYFEPVTLANCAIIVDANSLVAHIYNATLVHTSAFGGDYDKLAHEIERFFKRLEFHNVFPIVVFDGGVEKRKVSTIKSRCVQKVISLHNLNPTNCNSRCFPLLIRPAMKDKLLEMGVTVLQSDLEADCDIAALSKQLKIPVLSNDSDYFIFDVLYVPMPMLDLSAGTRTPLDCKIFRMDKFLRHLDIDRSKLPLLAVILGNDYLKRSQLSPFLGQIKLGKGRNATHTQKIIIGVLRWLKSETVDSAVQKILSCMRSRGREVLKHRIMKIMQGYTQLTTVLHEYLPSTDKIKPFDDSLFNLEEDLGCSILDSSEESSDFESGDEVECAAEEQEGSVKSCSEANSYCSSEGEESECKVSPSEYVKIEPIKTEELTGKIASYLPKWLLDRSRRGLVPPSIFSMANLEAYYSNPQPECYSMLFAGKQYLSLILHIAGLIFGPTNIQVWHRMSGCKYGYEVLSSVPYKYKHGDLHLEEIGHLSVEERRKVVNDITGVDLSAEQIPDEWRLYLVTVIYWVANTDAKELQHHHIHAVIMMMVTLLVVDENIGFHRQRKTFIKKYGSLVNKIAKSREKWKPSEHSLTTDSLQKAILSVQKNDCIVIFDSLISHFHVDRQIRCSKHFSSLVIHLFARLQSCYEFISMLNAALHSPYSDMKIHKFYNGTFLYNMVGVLKGRSNLLAYIDQFFVKAPSLLGVYKHIYNVILFHSGFVPAARGKKLRTKKVHKEPVEGGQEFGLGNAAKDHKTDSDSEPFVDFNNPFSLLNIVCKD